MRHNKQAEIVVTKSHIFVSFVVGPSMWSVEKNWQKNGPWFRMKLMCWSLTDHPTDMEIKSQCVDDRIMMLASSGVGLFLVRNRSCGGSSVGCVDLLHRVQAIKPKFHVFGLFLDNSWRRYTIRCWVRSYSRGLRCVLFVFYDMCGCGCLQGRPDKTTCGQHLSMLPHVICITVPPKNRSCFTSKWKINQKMNCETLNFLRCNKLRYCQPHIETRFSKSRWKLQTSQSCATNMFVWQKDHTSSRSSKSAAISRCFVDYFLWFCVDVQ